MDWIDNMPPLKPLLEKLGEKKYRIMYRGAEPIKAFAVYTIARSENIKIENATLLKVFTEDKVFEIRS